MKIQETRTWCGFWSRVPILKYFLPPLLRQLDLTVEVKGMAEILLENSDGVINPAKPFFPFGSVPRRGSEFLVGSYEVFQKHLTRIQLNVRWGDLPAKEVDGTLELDFPGHYSNYKFPTGSPPYVPGDFDNQTKSQTIFDTNDAGNELFNATVQLLNQGFWNELPVGVEPESPFACSALLRVSLECWKAKEKRSWRTE